MYGGVILCQKRMFSAQECQVSPLVATSLLDWSTARSVTVATASLGPAWGRRSATWTARARRAQSAGAWPACPSTRWRNCSRVRGDVSMNMMMGAAVPAYTGDWSPVVQTHPEPYSLSAPHDRSLHAHYYTNKHGFILHSVKITHTQ